MDIIKASSVASPGVASDQAAAINAALASATVLGIELDGEYFVDRSVMIPSGKLILGRSKYTDGFTALATFDRAINFNAVVMPAIVGGVIPSSVGQQVRNIFVDAAKVGNGGSLSDRIHGVMMHRVTGFLCEDLIIRNVTGYGSFTQGVEGEGGDPAGGVWNRVDHYNCSIHSEQMAAHDVKVIDCNFLDGDGDITCIGWLHPLSGCRNIEYVRCRGVGQAYTGIEITSNVLAQKGLLIDQCHLEILPRPDGQTGGIAFVANGVNGMSGLYVDGGTFKAPYIAANVTYLKGQIHGATFEGGNQGVNATGADVDLAVFDSRSFADHPTSVSNALNAVGGAKVRWDGGSLEADNPNVGGLLTASTKVLPGNGASWFSQSITNGNSNGGTAPIIVGSTTNLPMTFPVVSGRRYLVTITGSWKAPATHGMAMRLTGSGAAKGGGSLRLGAAEAVAADMATSTPISLTATSTGSFQPVEGELALVCTTSGNLSVDFAATTAGQSAQLAPGFAVTVTEAN